MSETFKRDLKDGKEVEEKYLRIIKSMFSDAYIVDGYCKELDIYVPSEKIGFEIKSDKKSVETGNIVVEIEFNGKPSALSTSKALWWIFDTGKESFKVRLSRLKTLVNDYKPVEFTGRGDSKMKKAYLIPVKDIRGISEEWG